MAHRFLSALPRGLDRFVVRADLWGLLAALALAFVWFGWQGLVIVLLAGLPLAARQGKVSSPPQFLLAQPATDGLTGLPLRATVECALDMILRHSASTGKSTACLVICLDDPQVLTERYGQAAHDQAVRRMGERLAVTLRQHDILARLEGPRFAVALGPVRHVDLESLIQIASRLQAAVQEPLSIDAMTVYTSCSIGFCLPARAPEQTGAALLTAAELATDDAWRNGPSAIRAYSMEITHAARSRQTLRDEIEAAFESGQIIAYFQPQLSTDTGAVSGFEALARWKHPDRGLLPPAEFLPAIQSGGLTARLGEVMLFQSLNALRAWSRAGYEVGNVAVNFSKEELRNPRLVEKLRWEMDRFDLSPNRLTVEILESVVAETENDVIVHNIAALAGLGCGIDLDDFGTGHASITSIRRFAVKRIKIDRSFVSRVDCDPSQQKMIMAILSMAEQLGLETLAEGVETVGEHAMLAQLGCNHVQGYMIARPLPFEETILWLERHKSKTQAAPKLGRRIG
ncbi:MAG: bifunctional diguanylate cyclase/phosphodiesterase [Rhodobacteraceae bacterium]|nr:bifunctional diguanylate cyclase/phosphodiesterase [Paracoccaceae bacterium]